MNKERINELEQQIAALKGRWPAHSVPPAMMDQLDALEEELEKEVRGEGEEGIEAEWNGEAFQVRAIGFVENDVEQTMPPEAFQAVESCLVIDPVLVDGLQGLEPGQPVQVLFYFHRAQGFDLLQHPKGDPERPKRGVFALHSPRRPNPIGVTSVELIAVEGNVLRVRGLDAINGTPVLDIKPE